MKTIFPIVALIYLLGCQGISPHPPKPVKVSSQAHTVNLSNEQAVKQSLYSQLESWKGTTYQFGGLTKEGIDCSGFVYLTYLSKFGIKLPRSTEQQANIGRKVSPKTLQPGIWFSFKPVCPPSMSEFLLKTESLSTHPKVAGLSYPV